MVAYSLPSQHSTVFERWRLSQTDIPLNVMHMESRSSPFSDGQLQDCTRLLSTLEAAITNFAMRTFATALDVIRSKTAIVLIVLTTPSYTPVLPVSLVEADLVFAFVVETRRHTFQS